MKSAQQQQRHTATRTATSVAGPVLPRRQWSLRPGDTAAVPGVRHGIMAALREEAVRDADLWSAEIIVAELLSNAVRHTSGPAVVSLRWDGDHPLLSVSDDGPGPASLLPLPDELPTDTMADGGRGLFLVANLALGVRVDPVRDPDSRQGGSLVSVMLDVARPA